MDELGIQGMVKVAGAGYVQRQHLSSMEGCYRILPSLLRGSFSACSPLYSRKTELHGPPPRILEISPKSASLHMSQRKSWKDVEVEAILHYETAFRSGRDPGIWDQVPHRVPCREPASPCVSAPLCLTNKDLKKKRGGSINLLGIWVAQSVELWR
ncbi:hypothetical protein VULLAG_LOCUS21564 [Vulpes lagopus]